MDQPGIIIKKESKQSKQNAPKLFNLTNLQGHITSKFNDFSSDKVLEIMQSLYEKKYLTYPRTSSRYLDDSQVNDAKESLNAVLDLPILNLINKDSVWQSQMKPRYSDGWEDIIGNCDTSVYLGVNDKFTAKYASELLGEPTIKTQNISRTPKGMGVDRKSESNNYIQRKLMFPNEIRNLENEKTYVDIKPSDKNLLGTISILGEVTVEDKPIVLIFLLKHKSFRTSTTYILEILHYRTLNTTSILNALLLNKFFNIPFH